MRKSFMGFGVEAVVGCALLAGTLAAQPRRTTLDGVFTSALAERGRKDFAAALRPLASLCVRRLRVGCACSPYHRFGWPVAGEAPYRL